jgi:hypothetical protein
MTRDEIKEAEAVVGKLVNSEQENWRQMEQLLMASLDQGSVLIKCSVQASKAKRQVEITRSVMKDMSLTDPQMRTLEAVTSHIIDQCDEILKLTK